jgi:hypothetical protein
MNLPTFSHKTMTLNILLFYPTLILGGYLIWDKSMILVILYSATLIVTLIVSRNFVCTPCYYYGKPCPSFGFSYLALIFPKAEKKPFNGRAAQTEARIIIVCSLMPIVALILSLLGITKPFTISELILMGLYVTLVISMGIVHQVTGCNKCEIEECPLSRA